MQDRREVRGDQGLEIVLSPGSADRPWWHPDPATDAAGRRVLVYALAPTGLTAALDGGVAAFSDLLDVASDHVARPLDRIDVPRAAFVYPEPAGKALPEAARGLAFSALLRLADDALAGLQGLHDRGLLHLAISPGRVRVATAPGEAPCATLGPPALDPPLDRAPGRVLAARVAPDLLPYMAPELLRGEPPDPRADLFSLGATLYRTLTGSEPFRGQTARERLHSISTERPAGLRGLRPEISDAAAAFVLQLLAPDRADRYPQAQAARRALRLLLGAEGAAPSLQEAAPPPGAGSAGMPPLASRFVGRAAERRVLRALLDRVWRDDGQSAPDRRVTAILDRRAPRPRGGNAGAGSEAAFERRQSERRGPDRRGHHRTSLLERPGEALVVITGAAGIGKTRFLQELAVEAALAGEAAFFLRARQLDRDRPHGCLLALCDGMGLRPPGCVAATDPQAVPGATLRDAVDAVLSFARETKTALLLDDLDEASRDTWDFVNDLVRARAADANRGTPLVVVVSAREAPPFDDDVVAQRVELGPLGSDDALELARSVLGTEEGIGRDVFEAIGVPFVIEAKARAVAGAEPVGAPQGGPPDVARLARRRLSSLDAAAKRLLESLVVAGADIEATACIRAAGLPPEEAARALRRLARSGLVDAAVTERERAPRGGALRVAVTAPRLVAAAVRAGLGARAEAFAAHLLADLEAGGAPSGALCRLALGSSEPERTLRLLLRAADEAWEVEAYARAARLYDQACRTAQDGLARAPRGGSSWTVHAAGRLHALDGRLTCLLRRAELSPALARPRRRGAAQSALEVADRLAELAARRLDRAGWIRARAGAAAALWVLGRPGPARAALPEALADPTDPTDTDGRRRWRSAAGEEASALLTAASTLARLTERRGPDAEALDALRTAIGGSRPQDEVGLTCWATALLGQARLALSAGERKEAERVLERVRVALPVAEHEGGPLFARLRARALGLEARLHERRGGGARLREVWTRAVDAARRGGDPHLLGRTLLGLARAVSSRGDLGEARRHGLAALGLLLRCGDELGIEDALAVLANAHLSGGGFELAIAVLNDLVTRRAVRGDAQRHTEALVALSLAYLRAGQPRPAVRCAESGCARLVGLETAPVRARALLALGQAVDARGDTGRAHALYDEALAAARAAPSAGLEVLALLGLADLALRTGRPDRAPQCIAEAERAIQATGAARLPDSGAPARLTGPGRALWLDALVRASRARVAGFSGDLAAARRESRGLPRPVAFAVRSVDRDLALERVEALLAASEPEAALEAAVDLAEPWRSAAQGKALLATAREGGRRRRGWQTPRVSEIVERSRVLLERALHSAGAAGLVRVARQAARGLAEAACAAGDDALAARLCDEAADADPADRLHHAQVGVLRLGIRLRAGELGKAAGLEAELLTLVPALGCPALELALLCEAARGRRLRGAHVEAQALTRRGQALLERLAPPDGEPFGPLPAWLSSLRERLESEVLAAERAHQASGASGPPVAVAATPLERVALALGALLADEPEARFEALCQLGCRVTGARYAVVVARDQAQAEVVAQAGRPGRSFLSQAVAASRGEAPDPAQVVRPLTAGDTVLGALALGPARSVGVGAELDALAALVADALRTRRLERGLARGERDLERLRDERRVRAARRRRAPTSDDADGPTEAELAAHGLVGTSRSMREVFGLLGRVSRSDVAVLIQGESGTGKELIARAVHRCGPRRAGPFTSINCGALPETLLEAELFGHVRGAFTGAQRDRTGLFEATDNGTLFLDEVCEMSPGMQVKLLRVLEEGEVRPVGAASVRKVDVRIVSASNRTLTDLVDEGRFRRDLFYRLNVIALTLPPLRERKEDIPVLVEHFLEQAAARTGMGKRLEGGVLEVLMRYAWPGNVRELRNEVQRAVTLAGETISPADLSPRVRAGQGAGPDEASLSLKERMARVEREFLEEALARVGNNKTRCAKAIGLSRYGLLKKLDKHGLR